MKNPLKFILGGKMNEKDRKKVDKIVTLCNKRKLSSFGYTEWNGADEHQLITLIKDAEKTVKLTNHRDWKYLLDKHYDGGFMIQNNDTQYGTDLNTSAPSVVGKTPLETLKNGWKQWSIPPFLVINANYYVKNISISDVICG